MLVLFSLSIWDVVQEWQLKDGRVHFGSKDVGIKMETPALQVVHNTLGYARELDRIV